jgi:uncharacterized protein DUF2793
MSAVLDPNLGLNYGYSLGEDGWNVGIDQNWKKLGGLAFLSVINRTTDSQPGSPSNGDRYIIPTGSSWGSTNQVAVRVAGVWEFYTPHEGWRCYDQTTGQYLVYTVANGWKQIIGVRVPSTGTGVFDVVFENTENLTANRALTITLNNANRSIALGGNLTLAKNLTTTGSGNITFSAAADANVAVPATGTLATINGSETLTNKTLTSPVINTPTGDVATITGSQTLTNKSLTSPTITGTPIIIGVPQTIHTNFVDTNNSTTVSPSVATLHSYTAPANTLAADGDYLEGEMGGTFGVNSQTSGVRLEVGGTVVVPQGGSLSWDFGVASGTIQAWRMQFTIARISSTQIYCDVTLITGTGNINASNTASSFSQGFAGESWGANITVSNLASNTLLIRGRTETNTSNSVRQLKTIIKRIKMS